MFSPVNGLRYAKTTTNRQQQPHITHNMVHHACGCLLHAQYTRSTVVNHKLSPVTRKRIQLGQHFFTDLKRGENFASDRPSVDFLSPHV